MGKSGTARTPQGAKTFRHIHPCACLLLALALAACAKGPAPQVETPSGLSCERLYTRAPGYLVVELAAGSDIFLTPTAQPFPVYCSAKDAHEALLLDASAGKIPRGDWQIFALDGGSELACEKSGRDVLCKPAKIVDWAPHEPVVSGVRGVPVTP